MRWGLLTTASALAAVTALGAGWSPGRRALPPPPAPPAAPAGSALGLERPAPPAAGRRPGRPPWRGARWQIVEQLAVQGVLVITVETSRRDAMTLAREIVEPIAAHYTEVLVYLRPPGATLAIRRVQWSPRGGYVEVVLATPDGVVKGS